MLTAAIEELVRIGAAGQRSLPTLLTAVQQLIAGQSGDLALEGRERVELDEVLTMEAGKTAALLAGSAAIGAVAVGASSAVTGELAAFGHELGMAFQLVDDILGTTGDTAVTGKSSSSDVRAGKRSSVIVAALGSGTPAADRLAALFASGPPTTEADVTLATKLIDEAGGLDWAAQEAERRLAKALAHLAASGAAAAPAADLEELARYVVERDR
jgi:geranylgeranyl diphosphate synthase type I